MYIGIDIWSTSKYFVIPLLSFPLILSVYSNILIVLRRVSEFLWNGSQWRKSVFDVGGDDCQWQLMGKTYCTLAVRARGGI